MSLLERLSSDAAWRDYLEYKIQCGNMTKREEKDLVKFISCREFMPVVNAIPDGFGVPSKKLIAKPGSDKKRVVYTFSREENYVLKLLTYLLLRKYNNVFTPNLYSFRVAHGVKEAITYIRNDRQLCNRYVYKIDIHDYFNSVDIDCMLSILEQTLADDALIFRFIAALLRNPYVKDLDGKIIEERKGIMAGVPLASFLANVYLKDLDKWFFDHGNKYARYSDDIIVFAESPEQRQAYADRLAQALDKYHLEVNPRKVMTADPGKRWSFLGVSYQDGIFDISDVSYNKITAKMRRKYRALIRWRKRKGFEPEKAAKAFIKAFNMKFFDLTESNDLTWTRWFFPLINTDVTLRRIDHYMQQCIRYIMTERRSMRRFDCRYADLKALGYRSLVNEYYKQKEDNKQIETE